MISYELYNIIPSPQKPLPPGALSSGCVLADDEYGPSLSTQHLQLNDIRAGGKQRDGFKNLAMINWKK